MDSVKLEPEGAFYSALAESFFKHPGKSDPVGKHNIKDISKVWKIGQKITTKMITSLSPLPNDEGLELEGYEDLGQSSSKVSTPQKSTPRNSKGNENMRGSLSERMRF